MRTIHLLLAAALALPFVADLGAQTPDWNQWRGPTRDSLLANASWPSSLKGLKLKWDRPHSPSYSGPIVHEGTVFTTETIDKATERVTAYDLSSGDLKWEVEWAGAMAVPFFAASNGDWIRSTPACQNGHLIVLGMRDVLVSLDPKTGAEHWRVDFPKAMGTPLPSFGAVCSPLIVGEAVYVQTGGALVKLSLETGSVIWNSLEDSGGMMSSGAFSSPVIATLAGQRQLVVQTRQALCGVDMETGKVLWSQAIEAFRGMNILTPLVTGDRVFTSAYNGKAQLFEVARSEAGKWSIDEVWTQKSQAYMSSPVLIGDSIYMHLKNQRFTCLDVRDGSIKWTTAPFGKYWSMVSNGSEILALDSGGELRLIQGAEADFNLIDQARVAEDSWAHVAVVGNQVIVRDLSGLKVFEWK